MFNTLSSILKTAGVAVLFGALVVKAWSFFSPRPAPVPVSGNRVITKFVAAASGDLLHERSNVRTATLLHFANDPHGIIARNLRAGIKKIHALTLLPKSKLHSLETRLHVSGAAAVTPATALRAAKKSHEQGAVFGTVHRFATTVSGATLDCTVALASVARGRIIFQKDYKFNTRPAGAAGGSAATDGRMSISAFLLRLLIWAGLVLALPLGALPTIRATVRRASNGLNGALLCVLTGVDALLAYLLLGAGFGSWLAALSFILFACAAVAYNLEVMARVARAQA